jgi:hypothetical protein
MCCEIDRAVAGSEYAVAGSEYNGGVEQRE